MEAVAGGVDPQPRPPWREPDRSERRSARMRCEHVLGMDSDRADEAGRSPPGVLVSFGADFVARAPRDRPCSRHAFGDEAGVEARLLFAEVLEERAVLRQ